ncbi:hypothetical protein M5K25_011362 [Dendrobium thyrsiflorum]|uniref:Uncharacterized protein n=1 Tax=Dendrobium thyrsiflorum TaxID=117978 RepID=A0ABD0V240_DENTH
MKELGQSDQSISRPHSFRHIRLVDIRSFLSTLHSLFQFGQVNVGSAFLPSALPFRSGQVDSSPFFSLLLTHCFDLVRQIVGLSTLYSSFRFGQMSIESSTFTVSIWSDSWFFFSTPYSSFRFGQMSIESFTFIVSIWSGECWIPSVPFILLFRFGQADS